MYEQLSELLSGASFIYGPTSQDVAFSTPVHSAATVVGRDWYIGTWEPVEALSGILIPAPAVEVLAEEPAPADTPAV